MSINFKIVLLYITFIGLFGFGSGCTSNKQLEIEQQEKELYICAAASLTASMEEVVIAYKEQHPYVDIQLNLASSGSLKRQIEQGAPADVFVSASLVQMEGLESEGFLDEGYKTLLLNQMVLAVPVGHESPKNFDDLLSSNQYIIAMGEPDSVPAGAYGRQVLETLDIYESLESQIVMAKDVTEIITWLENQEVDAGLVYITDAKNATGVHVVAFAPEGSHEPVTYPCAKLKESQSKEEADAFIAFLFSEEGQEIFQSYGFECP